jgi:hypothetical protein
MLTLKRADHELVKPVSNAAHAGVHVPGVLAHPIDNPAASGILVFSFRLPFINQPGFYHEKNRTTA